MHKDERDLLEVLKFELEFLEKGGYGRSPRAPWRPQFIFEDSPTCMNYDNKEHPDPCGDCILMKLVPPEGWTKDIPCRHIPLDAAGDTLDSLYRTTDQHEIEDTFGSWLRVTIKRLEEERAEMRSENPQRPVPPGHASVGIPLHENIHPKCANPACPAAFHWLGGGKLFRFFPREAPSDSAKPPAGLPDKSHGVKHHWLCERCSSVFGLGFEEGQGVILKLLWPELTAGEKKEHSTAV